MKQKPEYIKQKDWDSVDSPPLSDEMLEKMEPVSKHHPQIPKRVRGPQKKPLKIPISIRLSPEVLSYFRTQGRGWQSRIDKILKEYIRERENI